MKKQLIYSMFLLLVGGSSLGVTSCGDDDDQPVVVAGDVKVSLSQESFLVGPEGESMVLKVTADADWAIRTDADWMTVRPSGGLKNKETEVQITVKANPDMEERKGQLDIVSGGKTVKSVPVVQSYVKKAFLSQNTIVMGAQATQTIIKVTANADWSMTVSDQWLSINPAKGGAGETEVTVAASENTTADERTGTATLKCGDTSLELKITQLSDAIVTPEGYQLVWDDEFNGGPEPGKDWVLENWPAGYVNNELQIYTSKKIDGKSTVEVKDGFLNITCFKAADGKIYSGRMNACPSTGWLYGYFEARILLPKGKGTWPAFWMMPCNVDWGTNPWPKCGEIDIMEEVGANPDYVSSSLHTEKYNHTKGTQITHEMKCPGAEESFHVYALEWTPDEITTYVDGKVQLRASKAAMGADHDCWPFHYAFYPILNLAWGGDWGGYKGVDENALPATMKVDYVRIFQKK